VTILRGKSILVTGGTGSFGRRFVRHVLAKHDPARLVIFSRDEFKQYEFANELGDEPRVRFFIGDVRDPGRLWRAFDGIDIVVHAAALKQVPAAEYNPFEAIKTNIQGAQNVIDAALDRGVEKVIALSTDKASSPINLYGATKLVSDKLFVAANAYAGTNPTRFAVVRYGNVVGSRGSVVPFFKQLAPTGVIPITDDRMTRFWISLAQGVDFVIAMIDEMHGGELFVPKIPSMRILDLAAALAPGARLEIVGIRPGEKLHEQMISADDARRTLDAGGFFVIQPDADWWDGQTWARAAPVAEEFSYTSDKNDHWLTVDQLRELSDG
jgi:UDP-N-acetylglucosamine 4,6-dehydratase/5-epimerase